MKSFARFAFVTVALLSLNSCGGGGGGSPRPHSEGAVEITVANSPATDGIFDPAPMADGSGNLWMSYSVVATSPNDPALSRVQTRIAASTDKGDTWTDSGIDPNHMTDPDFEVDDGHGGKLWATWRFEVSRLLYDPYDDASRRWKILWHRYAALTGNFRLFQYGWIGLSTAAAPIGTWSTERKLFTGTLYNNTVLDPIIGHIDMDTIIRAPEFPLAATYPVIAQLGNCLAFTEPGMLARSNGIYVSLQCAAATPTEGKIVLLRCEHDFSTCSYIGDLLKNDEAAQFSLSGQSLTGFAAPELVESGGTVYLIVTGQETEPYRGCLVFRINELDAATVVRSGGNPVLVKRVAGTAGSFNGACGYHTGATGSGIIYSEFNNSAPHFRLYASHIQLP